MIAITRHWLTSRSVDDDVHAAARAMSLCVFLWMLKAYLAYWYIFVRRIDALGELTFDQRLLLGGGDVIICAVIAAVYFVIYQGSRLLPQHAGSVAGAVLPFLLHCAAAAFSVVSWQVNQIYGQPLEIRHIRALGDLRVAWSSVSANLTYLPLLWFGVGVASFPLLGRLIGRAAGRVSWLHVRWRLWAATGLVTVVLGGLWAVRLRGAYAYGLKKNAIIHFCQYYTAAPKRVDLPGMLRTESAAVHGYEHALQSMPSLQMPGRLHTRDFAAPPTADGFNLVLIILESTASGYLDRQTTPNLMRLADTGLRFMDHAPTTAASCRAVYSILYSDHLMDIGVPPRTLYKGPMPQSSLARVLKAAGYQTAFFHSGFLDYEDMEYLLGDFDMRVGAANMLSSGRRWTWGVYEEDTVEAMRKWIQANAGRRLFAVYSTMFPHHPYLSPVSDKPFSQETVMGQYRNALYYTDRNIGSLVQAIEQRGLRDKTIIAVVSDHGEIVTAHVHGHGIALVMEELRIPLIISSPKLFPWRQQSRLTTNHLDIAPTLAGLLGVGAPAEWLGRNLLMDPIPGRMHYVNMNLGGINGLLDNGLIYQLDENSGRTEMREALQNRITSLRSDDPRLAARNAYEQRLALFQHWILWRHLMRASRLADGTGR